MQRCPNSINFPALNSRKDECSRSSTKKRKEGTTNYKYESIIL
uniref:Uncharacterized protein n=1 Tax=Arundo donax TaxID=35708 RepID=A0A0A9FWB1_ARUDO